MSATIMFSFAVVAIGDVGVIRPQAEVCSAAWCVAEANLTFVHRSYSVFRNGRNYERGVEGPDQVSIPLRPIFLATYE